MKKDLIFEKKILDNLEKQMYESNIHLEEKKEAMKGLGRFLGTYYRYLNENTIFEKPKEHPYGVLMYSQDCKNYISTLADNVLSINQSGLNGVRSVLEAFMKVDSLVNISGRNSKKVFFRGQMSKEWAINSRLFRSIIKKKLDINQINLNRITNSNLTEFELEQIRSFQTEVDNNRTLKQEITDDILELPGKDNMNWWALMQHYSKIGTRMIDITTSLLVALFFACSDWDSVLDIAGLNGDDGHDGALYIIFPQFEKPDDLKSVNLLNIYDELYYDGINYPMLPHSLSKRIVMQESYFYVTKDIQDSISFNNAYSLFVDKNYKQSILNELKMYGIDKEKLKEGWNFK